MFPTGEIRGARITRIPFLICCKGTICCPALLSLAKVEQESVSRHLDILVQAARCDFSAIGNINVVDIAFQPLSHI